MRQPRKGVPYSILMAEDDPDDRLFIEQAFNDLKISGKLHFVENGEELMNFLLRRGAYADPRLSPQPSLILLDLNMPKKDGRQCLMEIKSDSGLKDIPVVVWTTSNLEEDMARCYEAGADSYITKPASYPGLLEAVKEIGLKWVSSSVRESEEGQRTDLTIRPSACKQVAEKRPSPRDKAHGI